MNDLKPELKEMNDTGFPRKGSNGSSSGPYYTVEVRYDYFQPKLHGDFIIDREWRTLPVALSPIGVPNNVFSAQAANHGLLSWPCANALRWWAHSMFGLCLQSRIVVHEMKESYSITTLGYHDVIGGGGSDDKTRMAHRPFGPMQTEPVPFHLASKA